MPLKAIAPGVINTPMSAQRLATSEGGQVIFIDGGSEVLARGDSTW